MKMLRSTLGARRIARWGRRARSASAERGRENLMNCGLGVKMQYCTFTPGSRFGVINLRWNFKEAA